MERGKRGVVSTEKTTNKNKRGKDIRIEVREEFHEDLTSIARSMGLTLAGLIRPKLIQLRDENQRHLRKHSID